MINSLLPYLLGAAQQVTSFWMPPQSLRTQRRSTSFSTHLLRLRSVPHHDGAVAVRSGAPPEGPGRSASPTSRAVTFLEIGWSVVLGVFMLAMFWYGFDIWIEQVARLPTSVC